MSGREGEDVEDMDEALFSGVLGAPPLGRSQRLEYDPDVEDLNNPDVEALAEPPMIGGQAPATEMFGVSASPLGRPSSPKLYAQAGQFPTAAQFRVWRYENGIPVGLGAIDIQANEDDLVRSFFDAMPRPGDGRFMFKLRPIDVRGNELGKEITINISEHHQMVKYMREQKRRDKEEHMDQYGRRGSGDVYVNGGGGDAVGASYAEEMGRMFEQAVGAAEDRTVSLQETLEQERARLREEDKARSDERVSMASRSAEAVQKMTEKMMETERLRSQETVAGQKEHGQILLSTISTVFTQQQEAARQQAERAREADAAKMNQDREFFERQRLDGEARRRQDRDEADRKRALEREESERSRAAERERLQAEATRQEGQRKYELEQMRLEASKREQELERRRQSEQEEAERRRQNDKSEAEQRLEQQKVDLQHRQEQLRLEAEQRREQAVERRRSEDAEWARRQTVEREERAAKERADRDRWEREKQEMQARLEEQRRQDDRRREEENTRREEQRRLDEQKRVEQQRQDDQRREEERKDWDRREAQRREDIARQDRERADAASRDAERRREEVQLQMKQMEQGAQRDREHSERMMKMTQIDRDAQREAAERREKGEAEARLQADRDRQRQHDMEMKRLESQATADREHAERMLQLSKTQGGGGGIIDQLGMETPELLARIFGGGGEGGDGWADAIPKVLGSIADLGKVAMQNKQGGSQGRRPLPGGHPGQPRIPIVSNIPPGVLPPAPPPAAALPPGLDLSEFDGDFHLPHAAQIPKPSQADAAPAAPQEAESSYSLGSNVNTLKRAKEAGLSLLDQKKARKALKALGEALGKAGEEEWTGIITAALTKEVSIFHYIQAVTVYAALAEAKVEEGLADRIVSSMKESQMIPENVVPYNEGDYAQAAAVAAAPAKGGDQ